MRLVICDTVDYVAEWSAKYVLKRINDFQPNENKYFVLGLPTGMFYYSFKFIVEVFKINVTCCSLLFRWYTFGNVQETYRIL